MFTSMTNDQGQASQLPNDPIPNDPITNSGLSFNRFKYGG